jgi:hypothetical protein
MPYAEAVSGEFDRVRDSIQNYLTWHRELWRTFDDQIARTVRPVIEQRRARISCPCGISRHIEPEALARIAGRSVTFAEESALTNTPAEGGDLGQPNRNVPHDYVWFVPLLPTGLSRIQRCGPRSLEIQ